MFIDEVKIRVRAGKGGKGAVAFNKNMLSLGPVGGRGGNGGSVFFEGTSDIGALRSFRHRKVFEAEDGHDGKSQFNDGRAGEDLVLKVPVGTVIHDLTHHTTRELTLIGERVQAAEGGWGGHGNFHFRSSRNTSPRQSQPGLPGEEADLRLELKLIADVGLIGFPNAGKSSLLNVLTRAGAKVGNYPFTTLEPNLGTFYELILADIPGLIEGASIGKGLGVTFLRHIERTKILFHLVSLEEEDPAHAYMLVRKELGAYAKDLLEKQEYVFLTKADLVDKDIQKNALRTLKKLNKRTVLLSILEEDTVKEVKKMLADIAKEKHAPAPQPRGRSKRS